MASRRWGRASRLVTSAALALAVIAGLALARDAGVLATARVSATNLLFKTRVAQPARSTVIVGIDQRSYQALLARHGPLSHWPRTLYADALDALRAAGPRVIGFEIFFDAPRPEDEALAAAVRRAGNVVTPVVAQGPRRFDPRPGVAQEFDVFVRPTPAVREAAAGEGVANLTATGDSVVRSVPVLLRVGAEEVPSMALTIAALHARRPRVVDGRAAPGVIHAAGRAIPVGEADTMLINFLGPPSSAERPGSFPIIPFVDVLARRFDPALVRDRIVLIGTTIRGVDEHPTPTTADTRMWGVEVLGNAVETVVHQRFLVAASRAVGTLAIAILGAVGTTVVMLPSPLAAAIAAVGALLGYFTIAALAFDGGTVLDLIYPPAALLLAFAVTLAYRVRFVESEERLVREAMTRYLSPAVSRWVLEDPRRLTLGGELREMTVLFNDMRGFTTLAHTLPPETVVRLLNRYRGVMGAIIFRHDGVLAQYAGDAIEAFWNAPMNQPDHARRACQAALDMRAALDEVRATFAEGGWAHLDIGIGLNTGPMVVGNTGSRERLDYTAVGDPVNVAARLEGLTKEYGVHIVAGEATRLAAGEAFAFRFLDLVAVKGRPQPLRAWELVGRADALAPPLAARLARYELGVELYRARRWTEAEKVFADLEHAAPDDGPTVLYLRRTREALHDPPPEDWDGVYVARTK
jgi:adenylate cyclase